MVKSFLQSNPTSIIVIILITGVSWFMPTIAEHNGYITFGYETSRYFALSISFTMTFIGGYIVNNQLGRVFFINETNVAFLLFFILISSLSTGFEHLIELSLLNLSFCVFMAMIFFMRGEESKVLNVFNSSFFIGILSLSNIFFLPFLYLVVSGIGSIRRFLISDLWMILVGLLLPFGIVYAFSFISDNYHFLSSRLALSFKAHFIPFFFYLSVVILIGFAVFGAVALKQNRSVFGVKILKTFNTLLYLFVISLVVGIVNLFLIDYSVFFSNIAIGVSILIASLFVYGEFKGKDIVLICVLMLLFVSKFFL